MTMQTIQFPSLMSDAFERAYNYSVETAGEPLPLAQGIKKLGRGIRNAVFGFGRFMARAINAQAEARAQAMRYTRAPW